MLDFKEQAKAELAKLQAQAIKVKEAMLPYQQEVEKLNAQIEGLELYLNGGKKPIVELQAPPSTGRLTGLDRIERILRRAKKPLHYLEILERLKTEENFDLGGTDPKSNMTAKLSASDRFFRVARGVYGLAEWGKKAPAEARA